MSDQVARSHHFGPQWYQRRFLTGGASEFWVLDKTPVTSVTGPDGRIRKITPKYLRRSGTKVLFQREDLYTVELPQVAPDEVERTFFGPVDDDGARANSMLGRWPETRGMLGGDGKIPKEFGHPTERMYDLLTYVDAQKTRTPKGLDQLRADMKRRGVANPSNANLMRPARLIRSCADG